MRLLLLIHDVSVLGGMEIQLVNLANGLAHAGHDVRLVSIRSSRDASRTARELGLRPDVVLLHLGARGRTARATTVGTLARMARRSDVVHCTGWDTSLWGRLAAIAARRPVVVADHAGSRAYQRSSTGASRAGWIALHNRLLDPFTSSTVICAERQREQLLVEGVRDDKIAVIFNGVPVEEMETQARLGFTRASLKIPSDAKVIAHVASFRSMKRQALTLETVAKLRAALDEDVRVVFAGTGPQEERVEALARKMGADWATFLGPQRNVASVFRVADLTVLPSSAEAMPMVILESITMGVPVVASDVGDVASMLESTSAGLCFDPDDHDAFFETARRVLTDGSLHQALAESALAARAEIDAATMVSRYVDVFRRATERQAPAGGDTTAEAGPRRACRARRGSETLLTG